MSPNCTPETSVMPNLRQHDAELRIRRPALRTDGFYSFILLRFLTSTLHVESLFLTGGSVSRLQQDVYFSFLLDGCDDHKWPIWVVIGGLFRVWRYRMSGTQQFIISGVWRGWSRMNRAERLIWLPFWSARLLTQRVSACTGSLSACNCTWTESKNKQLHSGYCIIITTKVRGGSYWNTKPGTSGAC